MHDAVSSTSGHAGPAVTPSSRAEPMWRTMARTAFPFIVVGAVWDIVAHLDVFPPRLFPPLEVVASAFIRLAGNGILLHHALDTVIRLFAGFAIAAVAGEVIGIAMGRSRFAEDVLLPLVSIGAPIPG